MYKKYTYKNIYLCTGYPIIEGTSKRDDFKQKTIVKNIQSNLFI